MLLTDALIDITLSNLRTFQLESLNLGNNILEELPAELGHLVNLKKLHLFANHIIILSSFVLCKCIRIETNLLQLINIIFTASTMSKKHIILVV